MVNEFDIRVSQVWEQGCDVLNAVMDICVVVKEGGPTDATPTLSWWWGLSAPETHRAMPAVA
jgi:hypothetical protein